MPHSTNKASASSYYCYLFKKFTIKSINIAVAIPINNIDGMLIKVNKNRKFYGKEKKAMVRKIN